MSLIDDTAERFLRIAAARWPQDLREDQSREWAGELYAIRNDGDSGRLRRAWAQLRFGLSLAASPPVDDLNKIPKGWREIMPQMGLVLRRVLLLVAAGAVCGGIQVLPNLANAGLGETFRGFDNSGPSRVFGVFASLVVAVGLCELGRRLGRTMPLSLRRERRFGSLVTAGLVVVCLGAVPAAVGGDVPQVATLEKLSFLLWAIPFIVLLAFTFRFARSGHNRGAWLLGVGGGLVLFQLLAVPVGLIFAYIGPIPGGLEALSPSTANLSQVDYADSPLWFLTSISGQQGGRWYDGAVTPEVMNGVVVAGMSNMVPMLLFATAFALGYLISSARPATAPVPVAETASVPAVATSFPARRYGGLAITTFGILTWAFILGFLMPLTDDYSVVDLRQYAICSIVLAAVGLVWARSGRAAAILPGLVFGASAVIAGVIFDRVNFAGPGAFLVAAGLGGALAVAAWFLGKAAEARKPGRIDARRTAIAVAVFTGYCAAGAPAIARRRFNPTGSEALDTWLLILAMVMALSFIGVAITAAWTAREPKPPARSALLLAVPLAAVLAAGAASVRDGWTVWDANVSAFLLVPLTLYLTAFIQWGRRDRTTVDYLKWGGAMLVTSVAAPLLMVPQLGVGSAVGAALENLSAPGQVEPFNGSLTAGLILAAAALAILISSRAVREPTPATVTSATKGSVTGETATA